jgi:hypothetical protein
MKNKEQEIEVKLLKIDCHCVVISIDQQKYWQVEQIVELFFFKKNIDYSAFCSDSRLSK